MSIIIYLFYIYIASLIPSIERPIFKDTGYVLHHAGDPSFDLFAEKLWSTVTFPMVSVSKYSERCSPEAHTATFMLLNPSVNARLHHCVLSLKKHGSVTHVGWGRGAGEVGRGVKVLLIYQQ